MIDKDITIKRLSDLLREVERIEFNHKFSRNTTEAARLSRRDIEILINELSTEPDES